MWVSCVKWKAFFIHSFTIHHSVISQQVVLLLGCFRVWSWFDLELRLDLCSVLLMSIWVYSGISSFFIHTEWMCVCMAPCSGLVSLPGYNPRSQCSHSRLHIQQDWPVRKSLDYSVFTSFPPVSMLLCEHTDGSPGIINLHFVIYEGLAVRYPAVSGTAHSGMLWWKEPEGMATSCCPLLHRAAVSVAPSTLGEPD